MKKKKINYKCLNEIIADKENPTEEDLKNAFNEKYFYYIMQKERNIFNTNEKEKSLLEDKAK